MSMKRTLVWLMVCWTVAFAAVAAGEDIKKTALYRRLKEGIDAVPAINTHDHLNPFAMIGPKDKTPDGEAVTLRTVWNLGYFPWIHTVAPWPAGGDFDAWWAKAKGHFDNARATSFYRYLLPAFQDLYGVDFDVITDDQARHLNSRIVMNYQDPRWLHHVITERANIALMVVDKYWARLSFSNDYPFTVSLCNVTSLVRGFHPSEFRNPLDDPYAYARKRKWKLDNLADYMDVLDRILAEARAAGAVCLKTTLAYNRTLRFDAVPAVRAAQAFGKPASALTPRLIRDFEDCIMWHLVRLSAKHGLPFQIHTGQARVQGSNPMLLADMIERNPRTKFILFHGGFPWVGETGVMAMRYRNVWVDSVWLPTLSYTMARRAFKEWLEVMPSDRIMWGSDARTAEGIYGATELTRRCLAEALAEKVSLDELKEAHARRIGRQIMRENALKLFPSLKKRLQAK